MHLKKNTTLQYEFSSQKSILSQLSIIFDIKVEIYLSFSDKNKARLNIVFSVKIQIFEFWRTKSHFPYVYFDPE